MLRLEYRSHMQVFNPPLFPRGQIISSQLSDRLTLKFLLALMVVMHETLNKVTDYNPRVNTEKQTETSAGEEKFL